MKKIIAILLVLSVMFVAFAASGVGSTTLTLQAEVAEKLYHGFTAADNTTADAVKSEMSVSGSGNRTVTALDLEGTDYQSIGYYNLYTTGNAQATVKFTTTPMRVLIDTTTYYVPYELKFVASSGLSNVTVGTSPIGAATVAVTSDPGSSDDTTVLTTTSNGLRWKTLALSVKFAGAANETFGLPESTGYQGTIIAAVTAQ